MRSMLKTSAAALAFFATATGGAFADGLTGDLKIFLDTSNPAPGRRWKR
jgi:multiple sugar transport system substrate-binding protein